mmetsp:Transcript_34464/g.78636  ORF Transcript_34464/g.78636 Transcript_34464/m.78636 type:complete len:146 (+) Transcript_34464:66-503(+)
MGCNSSSAIRAKITEEEEWMCLRHPPVTRPTPIQVFEVDADSRFLSENEGKNFRSTSSSPARDRDMKSGKAAVPLPPDMTMTADHIKQVDQLLQAVGKHPDDFKALVEGAREKRFCDADMITGQYSLPSNDSMDLQAQSYRVSSL